MKIIKVYRFLELSKVYYRPNTRYLLSEMEANALWNHALMMVGGNRNLIYREMTISSFMAYEKRYAGQDANGKRILLYRHHAWGDSLIASSIPRYLKFLYPHTEIIVYCHPEMFQFWRGNQFINGNIAVPLPIPWDGIMDYDWHICYEGMLENDMEIDQSNCYDSMFRFCGLLEVPDHFKRPFIFIRPDDYAAVHYLKEIPGFDLNSEYIVYHLGPNNENRAYPYFLSQKTLEFIFKSYPKLKVFIIGLDSDNLKKDLFKEFPQDRCVNLLSKLKDFRHLIPIIENAKAVICPDSSVGHLAACFPWVPTISLWGLFSPNDRVKYYPNHYPIWHPELCPRCPCHNHDFVIPQDMCSRAETFEYTKKLSIDPKQIEWCPVLAGIAPEEIMSILDNVLRGFRSKQHAEFERETPPIVKLEKEEIPEIQTIEETYP